MRSATGGSPTTSALAPRLFRLARVGWAALAILTLVIFAAGLRARHDALLVVCPDQACAHFQLSSASVAALHELGLTLNAYAVYLSVVVGFGVVAYVALAGVLVWRQHGNWVAITFASSLVASLPSLYFSVTEALTRAAPAWQTPIDVTRAGGVWLLFTACCVFPNGRFAPAWTRLLVPVSLIVMLPAALVAPLPVFARVAAVLLMAGVALQAYRYRRLFTASERRQGKWVILGTGLLALFLVALNFTPVLVPATRTPGLTEVLYLLAGATLTVLVSLIFVASAAIAILKHHLFDIDVIVNRALVYTTLTTLLAVIYGASVVLFQGVFLTATGQESDLAIIVSTLTTAAVFQPLRHRLRRFIYRRFYRRRYDASQALAHFAAAARDEVNLDRLAGRLIDVTQETVQPAHVSLWLRADPPPPPPASTWRYGSA